MLIIPAENAINWKRPPWVTMGLMMACVMVFLFYQGADDRKLDAAIEQYLDGNLLALEAPAYEDYLQREIRFEGDRQSVLELQEFQALREQDEQGWQAVTLLFDRDYYQYLQDNRDLIWSVAERNQWSEQRGAIEEQWISRMSAFQLGLVPSDLSLYTLITYQFLHGGWGHIIGNLLFLFLLGFSMGSQIPLVGASGSISGLMGMYVAIYGLQKIRFFYFLGVYFNYFRAPAIAMLPVWLGKEIYDYWFAGATGIAYMAHAGGLLAGAALVWLLGKSWLQVKEEFFEPEPEQQDEQFTRGYAQAMASVGRMEFDLARRQFEALRENYPDRTVLLEHLYQLAKLRPDLPEYRDLARTLMADAMNRRQPEQMLEVWNEYLSKGEAHHPLAVEDHNRVLFTSLKNHDLKAAEKAFERMRLKAEPDMVQEACRLLLTEFEKLQMEPKARHYRQLLRG